MNVERIIGRSAVATGDGDTLRCGMGELIGASDKEGSKAQAPIERRAGNAVGGRHLLFGGMPTASRQRRSGGRLRRWIGRRRRTAAVRLANGVTGRPLGDLRSERGALLDLDPFDAVELGAEDRQDPIRIVRVYPILEEF